MKQISFVGHPNPAIALKKHVLDDVLVVARGTEIEYWRGVTDFDPSDTRKSAFKAASDLAAMGRVFLYQRLIGGGLYSYIAKVI